MYLHLEEIHFNHVKTSAKNDAFNIRRNDLEPVTVPEWRRGVTAVPEHSPAAYARDEICGNHLTIKALFSCSDPETLEIEVRAIDGHAKRSAGLILRIARWLLRPFLRPIKSRNVLGEVRKRKVHFSNGLSKLVEFDLSDTRIKDAGVSVSDVRWCWQYRTRSTGWTEFATTTHRIYTVLALPTDPWNPNDAENSRLQMPWTQVLDYACSWAASAPDVDEAASLITESVHALGPRSLQYDQDKSGSPGFTFGNYFDCADFVTLLQGQRNKHGSQVNCDDCAAIVVCFSNILGCDLWESDMVDDFPLHPHKRIGLPSFYTSRFSYHCVAWKYPCDESAELFDACVRLDSDAHPETRPHPLFVPTRIRFGRLGEKEYRFRLTSEESKCVPIPKDMRRRKIAPIASDKFLTHIGPQSGVPIVSELLSSSLGVACEALGWELFDYRFLNPTESTISIQSFWRYQAEIGARLRVDIFVDSSAESGESKLKELLSRYHLLDIALDKDADFGEKVFSVPSKFVVLFSRQNFVLQLRNVGNKPLSCESLATFFDTLILNQKFPRPSKTMNQTA